MNKIKDYTISVYVENTYEEHAEQIKEAIEKLVELTGHRTEVKFKKEWE